MVTSIKSICIRDIYIGSTSTSIIDIWIRYFDIESTCSRGIYTKTAFVRDIEPRMLASLRVIWYIGGIELI